MSLLDLAQERGHVELPVGGSEALEPAGCLLELPATTHAIPAAGLVPGDGDVHEPLEEGPLVIRCGAPGLLERLVRLEVLTSPQELETAPVGAVDR